MARIAPKTLPAGRAVPGGNLSNPGSPTGVVADSPSNTPDRYICIHGHFYQPPRENPWLETVETQDSAAPYHDWNERVTAECYAPNGAARILNGENRISRILNNYGRISFNFGPTLLSWLKDNAPRVYRMILDADANSCRRFSGHGSAMAQVYNHIIMPLASTRDKITQIRWGIADFESRFQRAPEGMWLSETAVDSESLELLAEHGIRFVVLAPRQCARVRPLAAEATDNWTETPNASVDSTQPYLVQLKNGLSIAVFFYDGPRSQAIAFEGLLNDGMAFAGRLLSGFNAENRPQIVHVATDGESYGHHHRYGEMALAWALKWIESDGQAKLINYGEFLEKFPPVFAAQIVENSSWSCVHGVERWRANCGCNSGHPGWNQQWRKPLRETLDWLRDAVAPLVRQKAKTLFIDLDEARNDYIHVVLDRQHRRSFLARQSSRKLTPEEHMTALELMELERHAMLMYTSCGWFFDEISGIEAVQVIAYASRVLQLAATLFGTEGAALEAEFVRRMGEAKSNVPEQKDGAAIYARSAKRTQVGLEQVAVHYAISSIFTTYSDQTDLFCYTIRRLSYEVVTSGRGRLVICQLHVCSDITEEQDTVTVAVLHFGDQNITAAVKPYDDSQAEAHEAFIQAGRTAVIGADFPAVIRLFDRYFPEPFYNIQSLFRDEQLRIVNLLLKTTLSEVEANLASIYQDQAALLQFLSQSNLPRPSALTLAATFAINAGLRKALENDPIDAIQVRAYLGLSRADQIAIDKPLLSYIADQQMKRAMIGLEDEEGAGLEDLATLENALLVARTLSELPLELNLWQAQNIWYAVYRRTGYACSIERNSWCEKFFELGKLMRISVEELVIEEEEASPAEPLSSNVGIG